MSRRDWVRDGTKYHPIEVLANRRGMKHAYHKGPGMGDAPLCGRTVWDGNMKDTGAPLCKACEAILLEIRPAVVKKPKEPKKAIPVGHDTPRWWVQPFPHQPHQVLNHNYVWCDVHCDIHEAKRDPYEEGMTDCRPLNWRAVFIGSDDPKEDFG